MSWPTLYVLFPGNAREALTYYQPVFGGDIEMFTYEQFHRDGTPDAIAHGMLTGRVSLSAADAGPDEEPVAMSGLMLTILGTEPELERGWFNRLAEDGQVLDDLQLRPWGDWDGQVLDRFGLRWLIGFSGDSQPA